MIVFSSRSTIFVWHLENTWKDVLLFIDSRFFIEFVRYIKQWLTRGMYVK